MERLRMSAVMFFAIFFLRIKKAKCQTEEDRLFNITTPTPPWDPSLLVGMAANPFDITIGPLEEPMLSSTVQPLVDFTMQPETHSITVPTVSKQITTEPNSVSTTSTQVPTSELNLQNPETAEQASEVDASITQEGVQKISWIGLLSRSIIALLGRRRTSESDDFSIPDTSTKSTNPTTTKPVVITTVHKKTDETANSAPDGMISSPSIPVHSSTSQTVKFRLPTSTTGRGNLGDDFSIPDTSTNPTTTKPVVITTVHKKTEETANSANDGMTSSPSIPVHSSTSQTVTFRLPTSTTRRGKLGDDFSFPDTSTIPTTTKPVIITTVHKKTEETANSANDGMTSSPSIPVQSSTSQTVTFRLPISTIGRGNLGDDFSFPDISTNPTTTKPVVITTVHKKTEETANSAPDGMTSSPSIPVHSSTSQTVTFRLPTSTTGRGNLGDDFSIPNTRTNPTTTKPVVITTVHKKTEETANSAPDGMTSSPSIPVHSSTGQIVTFRLPTSTTGRGNLETPNNISSKLEKVQSTTPGALELLHSRKTLIMLIKEGIDPTNLQKLKETLRATSRNVLLSNSNMKKTTKQPSKDNITNNEPLSSSTPVPNRKVTQFPSTMTSLVESTPMSIIMQVLTTSTPMPWIVPQVSAFTSTLSKHDRDGSTSNQDALKLLNSRKTLMMLNTEGADPSNLQKLKEALRALHNEVIAFETRQVSAKDLKINLVLKSTPASDADSTFTQGFWEGKQLGPTQRLDKDISIPSAATGRGLKLLRSRKTLMMLNKEGIDPTKLQELKDALRAINKEVIDFETGQLTSKEIITNPILKSTRESAADSSVTGKSQKMGKLRLSQLQEQELNARSVRILDAIKLLSSRKTLMMLTREGIDPSNLQNLKETLRAIHKNNSLLIQKSKGQEIKTAEFSANEEMSNSARLLSSNAISSRQIPFQSTVPSHVEGTTAVVITQAQTTTTPVTLINAKVSSLTATPSKHGQNGDISVQDAFELLHSKKTLMMLNKEGIDPTKLQELKETLRAINNEVFDLQTQHVPKDSSTNTVLR